MSDLDLSDISRIGLGTWQITDHEQCARTVRNALEIGYRHLDTAQMYNNERAVGEGLAEASVDRGNLFLATKVNLDNLGYEAVIESTGESLNRLGTDYVDLLYVHWPAGNYRPEETLTAFKRLQEQSKIRFIGLSNYNLDLLSKARDVLNGNIYAHQIEMHPLLQQSHLHQDALEHGMKLVAYSPFRHGTIFDEENLLKIAAKHEATPAQICLAWLLQKREVYPIPKATSRDHLKENFEALNLKLGASELEPIDQMERTDRYVNPPFAPEWEL